jgi:uncharacterized protein YlxW (UPF0749 family)
LRAIITGDQRVAHLEQKVESLDRAVADLRRSVEGLIALLDEIRLEQIRMVVQSHGVGFEDKQ